MRRWLRDGLLAALAVVVVSAVLFPSARDELLIAALLIALVLFRVVVYTIAKKAEQGRKGEAPELMSFHLIGC